MSFSFKAGCLVLTITLSAAASAGQHSFPGAPDERLTPGSLCVTPKSYRYAERIPYCERDVSVGEKRAIISTYDNNLGFTVTRLPREDFKIDHLIPLCAGGSNEATNLWPQHKTIYEKTDLIEDLTCQLMAKGIFRQAEAVDLILDVKHHLEKAELVKRQLLDKLKR
jgi:hypothetical protein